MQHRAFTLMEMLISVAILAVLMGILIPGLPYASRLAEDAVCRSHLHGIAQSFHLYAASNRGSAPDEESLVSWHEQLRPYASNQEVFRCPSDTSDVDPSYVWRGGIRRMHATRGDAVLLFDFESGWHRESSFNVSLVDTSAHSYTDTQWLDDLDRPLR